MEEAEEEQIVNYETVPTIIQDASLFIKFTQKEKSHPLI